MKTPSILERNRQFIPGGVSSINRLVDMPIEFARARGAYLWDTAGKRYIDYHAGFAPYLLGHNAPIVNDAVAAVLAGEESLFGAGPSDLEGRVAELICRNIKVVDKVTFLNTGSEATSLAIRLSRAVTGRKHFVVMQGGYNGNHDELACNVFNTLQELGPRVSPGEYRLLPVGAGTTIEDARLVHVVNFNDLESVRYVCRRYPVAALITEPILQNIGVVLPKPGYLAGLRALADEFGFLLIFDEVKTGFRHGLGGYSEIAKVQPDLVTYGKAIANGFPLAVLGGKNEVMDYLVHKDPARRPFVAGTYNGHPVALAAAMRTVEHLVEHRETLYPALEAMGAHMQKGIESIFARHGLQGCVSRQGSAFAYYLMSALPQDFHDILERHDFPRDLAIRHAMRRSGSFFVPIATKQCSISVAHSREDVDQTLQHFEAAVVATKGR